MNPTNLCCVPPQYFAILDDLNNDDRPEVVWYRTWWDDSQYQNRIWVYDLSGNILPGWPVAWTTTGIVDIFPAVGDLLPDTPSKEIVFSDSTRGLRLLTFQGEEIHANGWPRPLGGLSLYPTIVNIDGTGPLEVLACEWNSGQHRIHAFRADGTEPAGWPITNPGGCYQSPFAADVDQNGTFEVILNDRTSVRIWEQTGGQPVVITPPQPVDDTIRVFDVDNQPGLEIVVPSRRDLRAYRPDGTELQNAVWPKTLNGNVEGFIAGDIRNDGTLDLLAFTSTSAYLFDLPSGAAAKNQFWPVDYGTPGRTSLVDQCTDGTPFSQCADNPVLQRCVNGELRPDSTCAPQPREIQQIAP